MCRELGGVEPGVLVEGPADDPELLADPERRAAVAVDDLAQLAAGYDAYIAAWSTDIAESLTRQE